MARFETIIVGVDGSGASEQMTQTLLKLPLFANSRITLLHVVPSQISADKMRSEWERGKKLLAASLDSFPVKPGVEVTTQLVEGDPKLVMCEAAAAAENPLVIMGSRGRNRIAAIFENSVSQYVFQLASCPMLLVKDGIFIKQTNRIMVAISSAPSSQRALELAIEMIKDVPGGQLFLARVQLDPDSSSRDAVVEATVATLKNYNIPHKVFSATGDPGPEISRLAAESGADLLVMGSPDRRPNAARSLPDLDRLLGSSTSDYVRVHAECPVLMVRSKTDTD
jgi:nucleotide-binding universal stress UspA family protein